MQSLNEFIEAKNNKLLFEEIGKLAVIHQINLAKFCDQFLEEQILIVQDEEQKEILLEMYMEAGIANRFIASRDNARMNAPRSTGNSLGGTLGKWTGKAADWLGNKWGNLQRKFINWGQDFSNAISPNQPQAQNQANQQPQPQANQPQANAQQANAQQANAQQANAQQANAQQANQAQTNQSQQASQQASNQDQSNQVSNQNQSNQSNQALNQSNDPSSQSAWELFPVQRGIQNLKKQQDAAQMLQTAYNILAQAGFQNQFLKKLKRLRSQLAV